jgi:hypothetical protein
MFTPVCALPHPTRGQYNNCFRLNISVALRLILTARIMERSSTEVPPFGTSKSSLIQVKHTSSGLPHSRALLLYVFRFSR